MGQIVYASTFEARFDDRVLAHLQIVIMAKLRRQESFSFSWTNPRDNGSGRTSLWLHPTIPLVFSFHGNRPPTINRAWIESLMASANSASGLRVLPEPIAPEAAVPAEAAVRLVHDELSIGTTGKGEAS